MIVPDRLTLCSPSECARAFRGALETVLGRTPSQAHLCVLVAQSALESGRWRSMHCWNFGNVKAAASYQGLVCQFRCNEVINGRVQWFDPPHPQCNFRAFTHIEAGAIDHMRFLAGRARYQAAWGAAQQGDPSAFVSALKRSGYFTADEAPYKRAVVSLFGEYMRMLGDPDRDTLPAPAPDDDLALAVVAPDPERMLHSEAVLAMMNFDLMDAVRDERNASMREP